MVESFNPRVPSPDEVATLPPETRAAMAAAYLGGIEPGRQPLELFSQLARLVVLNTVEVVPLRTNPESQSTEVFLLQRPDNDRWWPNQWHVPGVTVLPTDPVRDRTDFSGSINRVLDGELGGAIEFTGDLHFLEAQRRIGIRGHETTLVHWAEVATQHREVSGGGFFDAAGILRHPPEGGIVDGHAALIERAAAAYEQYRQS